MSNERRLSIENGKYTFVVPPNDYRVHVLRHGEPWIIIEKGCNAVWRLVADHLDATALIEAVKKWGGVGLGGIGPEAGHHGALYEAISRYQEANGEKPLNAPITPTQPDTWRTDAPPRGVRCLVTYRDLTGGRRVSIASVSPDYDDDIWFSDGHPLVRVIAWMPCPEPADPKTLQVTK